MKQAAVFKEDIEPNIDYELERFASAEDMRVTFNKEARDAYLCFAAAPEATWRANFRDLSASVTRMATLAPQGRINEETVRDEIAAWIDGAFGTPEPATEADLPGIRALLEAAALPVGDLPEADRFLVVRPGNVVLGSVAVEPYGDAGLLRSLAVAPEARGTGTGSRLVEAAEACAYADGLRSLVLLTTTAAPFFEARGYAPMDRAEAPAGVRQSSEFQGTCCASAVCLGKALSP